jgi:Flp pilus assembly pilin Flp
MRKGAAAVEFALVAPLFTLMLLGMIEVGRAIHVQQTLQNAVREGSRGWADTQGTFVPDLVTGQLVQSGTPDYAVFTTKRAMERAGLRLFARTDPLDGEGLISTTSAPYVSPAGKRATIVHVSVTIPYSQVSYFPAFFLKGKMTAETAFCKGPFE